jgi:hypothetical protein
MTEPAATALKMQDLRCLARLTQWEKTKGNHGESSTTSCHVKLCKTVPVSGNLCEGCKRRTSAGKTQSSMIHGLLTEEIPEYSHIFGSRWYWEKLRKSGSPPADWIAAALEAQAAAEAWCAGAGVVGWRVQRPSDSAVEEMVRKKSAAVQKKKADGRVAGATTLRDGRTAGAREDTVKGTLLASFPVIDKQFAETAEEPLATRAFEASMWKEERDGVEVWVFENGAVFSVGTTGRPARRL